MSSRPWSAVTATIDESGIPYRQLVYRTLGKSLYTWDSPYGTVLVVPNKLEVIVNHPKVTAIYRPWRFFIWEDIPREVSWNKLPDDLRYIVRASMWWSNIPMRIRDRKTPPVAPGGYEDDRYYTLEALAS